MGVSVSYGPLRGSPRRELGRTRDLCAEREDLAVPEDHFVSQFYLRNFAIPSQPSHVYSYQRNCKPIPKAIRSVARVRDFEYLSREGEGLKHDTISQRLNQIEDDTAPIIARLVTDEGFSISPEEWELVSLFIAHLIARGPSGRQEQINLFQATNITQAKVMAENKEAFHRSMQGTYSEAEIEDIRLKTLEFEKHYRINFEGSFFKDYSLVMSLLAGEIGSRCLLQKFPVLIKNSSQKEFITSDNPVVFNADPERYRRGSGLGLENSLIYLPLSPKRALLLVNRKPLKDVVSVDRDSVEPYNSEVMLYARDSLFSQSCSSQLAQAFDKTEPRLRETVVVENCNKTFRVSGNELFE